MVMKKFLLAALVTVASFGSAAAQTYPARPITLIVPSAAGGPTDTLARILTERMSKTLGQPFIIEDQGTAGGTIAVGRVARATPDGYTVCIGQWGNFVLNAAIYPLAYDLLNDFAPVAWVASNPQLIVSNNAVPAKNLKELIAWLKANPDKATQGTAGAGSPAHVAGLYFQSLTGTQFRFVPYKGAAPAMQDLLGGRIDLLFDQASNSLAQVRAGKIRAYAVTAKIRLPAAPDIPTVEEAGLPDFQVSVWHGLWAPKATPKDIVAKLNAAVVEALSDEHVRSRLAAIGQQIPSREQQTPEVLAGLQKREAEKWWPIVKSANIVSH
jgi:tripartite-type tricarboxylate transporter receptor subunit TctC